MYCTWKDFIYRYAIQKIIYKNACIFVPHKDTITHMDKTRSVARYK